MSNNIDTKALYNIGYGLYVITTNDGKKHNGMICNTVTQQTSTPALVSVTINKANYTCEVIQKTGVMNVNCLTVKAPFSIFQKFGFSSGRDNDKFAGESVKTSENGLVVLDKYVNSFMSLKVEQSIDLGTHIIFICDVTQCANLSKVETMSYTYYQEHVKPKPETEGKKGYVCKVCGWIYEGDELPSDIVCPLCKHGAADFEPIA